MEVLKTLLLEAKKEDSIIKAIKEGRKIIIDYQGDATSTKGIRIIEPYVLGYTSAGNLAVRAWLVRGKSDTPHGDGEDKLTERPGWRLYRVDRINTIDRVSEGGFFNINSAFLNKNRPKYNPNDKDLKNIVVSLEPGRRQLDENYIKSEIFKQVFNKIINY